MRWKGKTLPQFVPDEPVTKEVNAFWLFSNWTTCRNPSISSDNVSVIIKDAREIILKGYLGKICLNVLEHNGMTDAIMQ